ncbi:lipopolysaccharide heptosyltransferase I [Francisella frigiditurris]|uniref:Lipopolysaccharide heptosyltransferase 1 n=1 Tax=Francisella frigiditurris TaxID=1542390 RepID=A0A1J0KRV8_9GAMM|nr:lipopolysaccharide heptosyltransferase I [Francisella frigiditurris]APC96520.1 lipopolysaccharide heptosyltransferase I [Francisella frigiditurris]
MRILIIRLSAIGDIFHAFTVARDLREKFPKATIDWLVDEKFEDVARLCADIDNIIPIPFKKWRKKPLSLIQNLLEFRRELKQKGNRYDYILETHGLLKPALFAKFLFKGEILGLDSKSANDSVFASVFYKKKFRVSRDNIAIVRFRELASKAFNTNIKKPYQVLISSEAKDIDIKDYILLLHGTSKDSKKLSQEDWQNISKGILKNTDKNILVTYTDDKEKQLCDFLKTNLDNSRFIVLDTLGFKDFVKVVEKADLVLGVDTGFMHLANLLNKKVIGIYKDSNPNYVGLYESDIAKNLDYRCKSIRVEEINENISELIGK